MTPGNFGEMPRATKIEKEEYEEFTRDRLQELTLPWKESQGFLHIPAENIKIDPERRVIEIREPAKKMGTEDFELRDQFEKAYPISTIRPHAVYENQVFSGEKTPPSFSPEFGGRICFTDVKIYETTEGTYISMPIISPSTGQRYSGHGKFASTNLAHGTDQLNAGHIASAARKKETNTLTDLQQKNLKEKIISPAYEMPTGIWTIRLLNAKGRPSEIKNCHVARDEETGTLEIFQISKHHVFQEFDSLYTKEQLPPGVERINTLISLEELKKAKEDEPVALKKIYFADKPVHTLRDIPEKSRHLFEEKDGMLYFKNLKVVPPLRMFLAMEQKVIDATPDDARREIQSAIGKEFERVVEGLLSEKYGSKEHLVKKNEKLLSLSVPNVSDLKNIIADQPKVFQDWALSQTGKTISISPDFILPDKTFIETKKLSGKRDQLFRMALYKLIKNFTEREPLNIEYLSLELEEESQNPYFPWIKHQNIMKTEFAQEIEKYNLLKKIRSFQKDLEK